MKISENEKVVSAIAVREVAEPEETLAVGDGASSAQEAPVEAAEQ